MPRDDHDDGFVVASQESESRANAEKASLLKHGKINGASGDIGRRNGDIANVNYNGAGAAAALPEQRSNALAIPSYLQQHYYWAYLNPRNVRLLDREIIVKFILWGQHRRLRDAAFAELEPGSRVLQPACVYGDFSPALATYLGPQANLEITDIAPIQLAACRRKLRNLPQARVRRADASLADNNVFDAVCCYFLLHELPDDYKHKVVTALLERIRPGGKVVFVDYHKPHFAHPLKPITSLIFDRLEPFAKSLWRHEIVDFAAAPKHFSWRKQTFFGGLFQKVVARKTAQS